MPPYFCEPLSRKKQKRARDSIWRQCETNSPSNIWWNCLFFAFCAPVPGANALQNCPERVSKGRFFDQVWFRGQSAMISATIQMCARRVHFLPPSEPVCNGDSAIGRQLWSSEALWRALKLSIVASEFASGAHFASAIWRTFTAWKKMQAFCKSA